MNKPLHLKGTNFSDNNAPIVICVKYRKLNDYHVFTSDEVNGLYVCSKNPEQAVGDICDAVELLKWINEQVHCKVQLTQAFFDFIERERETNDGSGCASAELPLILNAA